MPDQKLTCIVTIHGMGFQQFPHDGLDGYADALHQSLSPYLGGQLGGDTDPDRTHNRTHDTGPIYVSSHWPSETGLQSSELGLSRLGTWKNEEHRCIVSDSQSLIRDGDRPIAHIALVYNHEGDQQIYLDSTLETALRAVINLKQYIALGRLLQLAVADANMLRKTSATKNEPTPSLRVRTDAPRAQKGQPGGSLTILNQLQSDICTYVCRNGLRERLRSFVHEAILRLCCREDVGTIIINAHSQGSVVAYDALRQFPPSAAQKVAVFVTAGSPLRKYVDLFNWGTDAACISAMQWTNFYDTLDPVGDPLYQAQSWRRGDGLDPNPITPLYHTTNDNGIDTPKQVKDHPVNNVKYSRGGGLVSHNYWDNIPEFIVPFAKIISDTMTG